MSYTATPESTETNQSAKRSAALFSMLAALGITVLKFLTGVLTGSLGMLSEAAHSTVDLVAAGITLFSVQVSDRPADDTHNYGHGKVESLSAFIECGLMLGSCGWIVTEAVRRIFYKERLDLVFSIWPFAVLLLSIAVDFTRAKRLHRTAKEHASLALEADAIHFSTDIWSSLAVMIGLATTYVGNRWDIHGLELADPIAGLVVSGIILKVIWQLGRKTIDTLLDATPEDARDAMRRLLIRDLMAIDGIVAVNRLRTRRSGAKYFADLSLGIARNLTFQRTEQISADATATVEQHLPGADVVIHSVPMAPIKESVHDRIRAVAARSNLAIHDVTVQQLADGLHVEQHMEVDEEMPLRQAHDLATRLEGDILREVSGVSSILTHIESEPATIEQPESQEHDRSLEVKLRHAAKAFPEILDTHDVMVTRTGPHLKVSCHTTMPDELPMSRVHEVITALEGAFKLEAPEVDRLLIHPEPETDNRR
ncbi:MAG TPA: cation diffusion facilitator family transporter [Edaphobacter sp.]